jgi:poly(hydroxyalkanoate) granule-associated protein
MVKKISKSTGSGSKSSARGGATGGLNTTRLAASVKDSAQQIWLAGMGAFSKVQEEGGKVFEALVREGMNLQNKTEGLAADKISEATGKMTAMADAITSKAGQNWDKLEAIFEQRTAKAMSKLGVPTAKDVQALTARVDELAAAVSKLSKATAKVGAKTAAKTPSRARKIAT